MCYVGIFQAVKRINDLGQTDVYIDGGLLCNYPVHAFDGKWPLTPLHLACA